MINISAPIIPYESIGGIKLKTHIKDLWDIINSKNVKATIPYDGLIIIYDIDEKISLIFNAMNGKIFAIEAMKKYKGKLFGKIGIGMYIDEVLKIEPSFIYNDFEEIYVSDKGIVIEIEVGTNKVSSIEISIKEGKIDKNINGDFIKGNW